MALPIRRLVLDVMKPHEPDVLEFAAIVGDCEGVAGINVALIETDRDVQNLKVTLEGDDIAAAAVEDAIIDLGGTVHSIDGVVRGERLVEERDTPQDR
ncbi:DUF211 domain-containing protein [Natrinema sp. 1APR25-10V2]|uniref:DUF211 domain-containing protein n=1 Tax=Natrinema sp. 1APR25-10V2 TaxID=2951081 RepID=UPI00287489FB|nr:DUF211 domain-containing protein [Natrinema sp. 1APR25-10V2]MDS0477681.1 DUF211 domain-containing protein [Natrinema sp. 1APR25-10V2]